MMITGVIETFAICRLYHCQFVVIFITKLSLMLKKQSMLVCFGMLPERSTHLQMQRPCTYHLVHNLRWIEPLASDGAVSGCRQKSSEFQLLSKHV